MVFNEGGTRGRIRTNARHASRPESLFLRSPDRIGAKGDVPKGWDYHATYVNMRGVIPRVRPYHHTISLSILALVVTKSTQMPP